MISVPSFKRLAFSVRYLIFSLFLVVSCYLLVAVSPSFAQTIPSSTSAEATNSYTIPSTNPDVPKNLHNYTQNVMLETMSALICQLVGIDPVNQKQECLGIDNKTGKIGFVKNGGGAIGVMGNMITMLYTPPTHTGEYFQNLAGNFGFAKSAHAENGTGFQGLSPLLGVWSAFRNIVYLLFVVVFVVVGLAIMLRVKIDPRTVMSIQNQIPKIIVGLVLVTFSFAIAGFLVDIMYTSIYLVGNAIVDTDPMAKKSLVVDIASSTNPFTAINDIAGADGAPLGLAGVAVNASNGVKGTLGDAIFGGNGQGGQIIGPGNVLGMILGATVGQILLKNSTVGKLADGVGSLISGVPFVGKFASNIAAGAIIGIVGFALGPWILSSIVWMIAFLVIIIAILFALFRLWFALLSAYVFILLDVVTAPFWIFAGLIPGSPIGFGLWLRDITSNLVAFPMTIVLFLLGRVFIDVFGTQQALGQFVPPLIGNASNTNAVGSLIGLGFILLTPNVVAMSKAALKAPKFDTTPIKQALGAGGAVTSGTARSTISSIHTYTQDSAQERLKHTGGKALIGKIFEKV